MFFALSLGAGVVPSGIFSLLAICFYGVITRFSLPGAHRVRTAFDQKFLIHIIWGEIMVVLHYNGIGAVCDGLSVEYCFHVF